VLALTLLAGFIIYEIAQYNDIRKTQSKIQSDLKTANLIIVTDSNVPMGKQFFQLVQNEKEFVSVFPELTENIIKIKSQTDIDKIIGSLVLKRKEQENCRCNGSHYLGFYHDMELLGIILIKHAACIKYIDKNNKYSSQYYLKKSDMSEITKVLKEHKIDLKQTQN